MSKFRPIVAVASLLLLLLLVVAPDTALGKMHPEPCFEPADFCRETGHGGFTFSPDGCNTCRCTQDGQLESCTMVMCPQDMSDQAWTDHCAELRRKAEAPIPVQEDEAL
ncbi:hypothetical protein BOX15_Mlig016275g4 [Macrostomum lignano]|uniref:Pacifastin domain-containing protein n=1 Tax=Macrostomum lignano TaxID=282301 RepID=A0A267GN95_9PLAT|nr:hypothetical protein BOX15_Mlig016275g4 [Macrostomum lignano]